MWSLHLADFADVGLTHHLHLVSVRSPSLSSTSTQTASTWITWSNEGNARVITNDLAALQQPQDHSRRGVQRSERSEKHNAYIRTYIRVKLEHQTQERVFATPKLSSESMFLVLAQSFKPCLIAAAQASG